MCIYVKSCVSMCVCVRVFIYDLNYFCCRYGVVILYIAIYSSITTSI